MSYRDLRNFSEMMRALNFPKHISMESFRQPNFPLVAEVLRWLIQRYDANAAIMDSVQKESDRILFMKSVTQFLAVKAHLKVNTKRLYQADRHAVKELLKVAALLYDAINSSKISAASGDSNIDADVGYVKKSEFSSKGPEIRKIRELSALITEKGASLFDLLEKEIELKRLRQDAVNKPPDIDGIGRDIQKAIKANEAEIHKTVKLLENVATDEANLETKIANRNEELERLQKRLKSISSVRPAFMDEYEVEEKKLEKLYEVYILKFRNLTYLESQLEEFHQAHQRDIEAFDNRVESAKQKPVFGNDNDDADDDPGLESESDDQEDPAKAQQQFQKRNDRPGGASAGKRGQPVAGGGMYNDEDEDSDDDDDSDNLELDDDDEDNDRDPTRGMQEDDDDDDDEVDDDDDDNF